MRSKSLTIWVMVLVITNIASATIDTFGTGANQFTIDFVNISGDSGDLGSWSAGSGYTFSGVNHGNYRMGTYEITNSQWSKFQATYGTVAGSPSNAYNQSAEWIGTSVPTNMLSWYEGAQFVNWLNTSTGHQAAYKFTGTINTSDYTLDVWGAGDSDGANLYRNKNAYYFLPTENEWVKAAYWNGTNLQQYATPDNTLPVEDIEANYGWALGTEPWNVGSGSEELNGTHDMMGNVLEWMESPYASGDYLSGSIRGVRGGSFSDHDGYLGSSYRHHADPDGESNCIGFRVASVPEPTTLLLLGLGGLIVRKRKQ